MVILCVGDVVGETGLRYFCDWIPGLRQSLGADLVIVNGENSDPSGVGLSRTGAETLLQYADVVTTGNHCFRRAKPELYLEMDSVLHPANFPQTRDRAGCCLIDTGRFGLLQVINLMGVAWMEPIDNPFLRADALLANTNAKYTIIDFHAESTAEKKALAFYLDGRVSAVFGTHTHVQTADEQILPAGTGYITDVGMTGPLLSVIGVDPPLAVQKQRCHVPVQFKVAEGPLALNAVLFTLDDTTGLCTAVQRINQ